MSNSRSKEIDGSGVKPNSNPELAFYFEVLKRMRLSHKDVVSDEELKEVRKFYTKYLEMTTADQLK